MNIHRKAKSGCEIAIDHFKNVCPGANFTTLILEKLPGNGYKNGTRDLAMLRYRLEREDYWIKKLRTVYPYGLNERTKLMNSDVPAGKLFPPLPRHGTRFVDKRNRSSNTTRVADLDSLVELIFSYDTDSRANHTRILFNKLKLSNLKSLAEEAYSILSTCEDHVKRWYDLLIDVYI